ncbi:MAG TPA: hypothetical protein ENK15_00180 [Thermopetrobacter sp.]|nr:hypothetical protein [Thermopetrobacter sp.]
MRMMWIAVPGLIVAACAQGGGPEKAPRLEAGPVKAAAARREPVIYNGRRYVVTFRKAGEGWLTTVAAPGRALGGTEGDRRIVEQIARSTVRHYTCRDGQKGRVRGPARHHDGVWRMTIRCL